MQTFRAAHHLSNALHSSQISALCMHAPQLRNSACVEWRLIERLMGFFQLQVGGGGTRLSDKIHRQISQVTSKRNPDRQLACTCHHAKDTHLMVSPQHKLSSQDHHKLVKTIALSGSKKGVYRETRGAKGADSPLWLLGHGIRAERENISSTAFWRLNRGLLG